MHKTLQTLLLLFVLCISFLGSQETMGIGRTKEKAIVDGWHRAMLKYIKRNYNRFLDHKPLIEKFVIENWETYTLSDPKNPKIIRKYSGASIRIWVKFDSKQLYRDVSKELRKLNQSKANAPIKTAYIKAMTKYLKEQLDSFFQNESRTSRSIFCFK